MRRSGKLTAILASFALGVTAVLGGAVAASAEEKTIDLEFVDQPSVSTFANHVAVKILNPPMSGTVSWELNVIPGGMDNPTGPTQYISEGSKSFILGMANIYIDNLDVEVGDSILLLVDMVDSSGVDTYSGAAAEYTVRADPEIPVGYPTEKVGEWAASFAIGENYQPDGEALNVGARYRISGIPRDRTSVIWVDTATAEDPDDWSEWNQYFVNTAEADTVNGYYELDVMAGKGNDNSPLEEGDFVRIRVQLDESIGVDVATYEVPASAAESNPRWSGSPDAEEFQTGASFLMRPPYAGHSVPYRVEIYKRITSSGIMSAYQGHLWEYLGNTTASSVSEGSVEDGRVLATFDNYDVAEGDIIKTIAAPVDDPSQTVVSTYVVPADNGTTNDTELLAVVNGDMDSASLFHNQDSLLVMGIPSNRDVFLYATASSPESPTYPLAGYVWQKVLRAERYGSTAMFDFGAVDHRYIPTYLVPGSVIRVYAYLNGETSDNARLLDEFTISTEGTMTDYPYVTFTNDSPRTTDGYVNAQYTIHNYYDGAGYIITYRYGESGNSLGSNGSGLVPASSFVDGEFTGNVTIGEVTDGVFTPFGGASFVQFAVCPESLDYCHYSEYFPVTGGNELNVIGASFNGESPTAYELYEGYDIHFTNVDTEDRYQIIFDAADESTFSVNGTFDASAIDEEGNATVHFQAHGLNNSVPGLGSTLTVYVSDDNAFFEDIFGYEITELGTPTEVEPDPVSGNWNGADPTNAEIADGASYTFSNLPDEDGQWKVTTSPTGLVHVDYAQGNLDDVTGGSATVTVAVTAPQGGNVNPGTHIGVWYSADGSAWTQLSDTVLTGLPNPTNGVVADIYPEDPTANELINGLTIILNGVAHSDNGTLTIFVDVDGDGTYEDEQTALIDGANNQSGIQEVAVQPGAGISGFGVGSEVLMVYTSNGYNKVLYDYTVTEEGAQPEPDPISAEWVTTPTSAGLAAEGVELNINNLDGTKDYTVTVSRTLIGGIDYAVIGSIDVSSDDIANGTATVNVVATRVDDSPLRTGDMVEVSIKEADSSDVATLIASHVVIDNSETVVPLGVFVDAEGNAIEGNPTAEQWMAGVHYRVDNLDDTKENQLRLYVKSYDEEEWSETPISVLDIDSEDIIDGSTVANLKAHRSNATTGNFPLYNGDAVRITLVVTDPADDDTVVFALLPNETVLFENVISGSSNPPSDNGGDGNGGNNSTTGGGTSTMPRTGSDDLSAMTLVGGVVGGSLLVALLALGALAIRRKTARQR